MKRTLVLALVLFLAACTVTPAFKPNTTVTPPKVGRPAPPSSVQAAVSSEAFTPYQNLGSSADDGLAPGETFSAISKACLTDAGYPNAASGIVFAGQLISASWGPWGYLGVAEAVQNGFSFSGGGAVYIQGGGALVAVGSVGKSASSAASSRAEQKATQKCDTLMGKFINSQMTGPLAGIQTLDNDIQTDVQHDPSIRAATKRWSTCMAQNGYQLTDPQTAFLNAIRSGAVAKAAVGSGSPSQSGRSPSQIALAVTDAECTSSSDLAGIYFAVQASYEQQLVTQNQQALNAAVIEYRDAYRKELAKLR